MKLEKIIRVSEGKLQFGDYESVEKQKQDGFVWEGNSYKVKSHREITRLEKNEHFLFESVPGSVVTDFEMKESDLSFTVLAETPVQITLGLEEEREYRLLINSTQVGKVSTNRSGKLSFSLTFESGKQQVRLERI